MSSTEQLLQYMTAAEAVSRSISGRQTLQVKWMDSGVPHATPDGLIALVRPKSLSEPYRWLFLSDCIHECGHIAYTNWEQLNRYQKRGYAPKWEFFHSIWNGFEDVFIEHESIRFEPGYGYCLRRGTARAKALGCVKPADGKLADLLPVTIIFHDYAQLRGWEEWKQEYEKANANLRLAAGDQPVEALEKILAGGVPTSTGQALKRARQVYELFEDFIDDLDKQGQKPSPGEVTDFGAAAEEEAKNPPQSDSESQNEDGESKSKPEDGEDEGDGTPTPSDDPDAGDDADEETVTREDDSPNDSDELSGGSGHGVLYPEVTYLRRPRSGNGDKCRQALTRFDSPRKTRKRSDRGALQANRAWQVQTGNVRVFSRTKNRVEPQLPALAVLVDISGSMRRAIEGTLDGLSGVLQAYERSKMPIGCWAFGSKEGPLVEVIDFHHSVQLAQARLASLEQFQGGDTPLGAATQRAMGKLAAVPARHRKMVILSDGLVGQADETLVRQARDWYGIELMLVSINAGLPPLEGVQAFSIDRVSQLPEVLRHL